MQNRPAVLGPANGPLDAPLVIVAEAPGRFGAGRTGIPFHGDQSGDNFEALIAHAGLTRQDMFITNAVLCSPLADGCNRRPTAREIGNCSPYLQSILNLVRPRLVVTLGTVGLDALNRLWDTRFRLAECAARLQTSGGLPLMPLYHPSPRVIHWRRPMDRQKKDFQAVARWLRRLEKA